MKRKTLKDFPGKPLMHVVIDKVSDRGESLEDLRKQPLMECEYPRCGKDTEEGLCPRHLELVEFFREKIACPCMRD